MSSGSDPTVSTLVPLEYRHILGTRVDATSYADAVDRVLTWARNAESRYICVANAHQVMEGYDSPEFGRVLREADLIVPDGMSLVWLLRHLGIHGQRRVYGPDLMVAACAAAQSHGVPVGFYGGRPETLDRLLTAMRARFPGLSIAYAYAPPFRPLTPHEDQEVVERIDASGARILFVGIGCPKQERWMAAHRGRVRAVMAGVGAAFDFHAGVVRQAPAWVQQASLEWSFRLLMEPRRLWRRYAKHNPRFAVLVALQLLHVRQFEGEQP